MAFSGTLRAGVSLEWDPYNYELAVNPFATFMRLREEAPLYYNEKHDFYALSRFEDCKEALADNETFLSGKGTILEIMRSAFPQPSGLFFFEDPPLHTIHRSLLARTFTAPCNANLEQPIRDFCARLLDPLLGGGGFDLIQDFSSELSMRV